MAIQTTYQEEIEIVRADFELGLVNLFFVTGDCGITVFFINVFNNR